MLLVLKKNKNIQIRKSDSNIPDKKEYSNICSHPYFLYWFIEICGCVVKS